MSGALTARAPGKVNLCLFVGPTRPDGRHELVSVVVPVSLADEVALEPAGGTASGDEVSCPGVEGENLAGRALAAFRAATGWDAPPQRVTVDKRVPVAGGMGGGSADAAATLRLAAAAHGNAADALLLDLAAGLGADVPAQVRPCPAVVEGAGERVAPLGAGPGELALAIVPLEARLATAAVYAEADRRGLPRSAGELDECRERVGAWAARGGAPDAGLVANDLQAAAVALCPEIEPALADVATAGADHALVSGSGPTVVGLFAGAGARARAEASAQGLRRSRPRTVVAVPVDPEFAAPRAADAVTAG